MRNYYVYMLASKRNGTLYIGVTSSLNKRIDAHKDKLIKGFTERYSVKILVYYEIFERVDEALIREKQLKKWKRVWKIDLIEGVNKDWNDLSWELW